MRRILGGIALSALVTLPALAADLPIRRSARVTTPPPIMAPEYNWSGFYAGLHAGYGWGTSEHSFVPAGPTSEHDVNGFVGGIQLGINWQFNRMVVGIEGALSLNGIEGSNVCAIVTTCETRIDHFWRAGGRVGFVGGPSSNWLFYGMGGFARAKTKTSVIFAGIESRDDTHHHGWYGGGGVEYAISPNFIVGVEGYFVSLGAERHPVFAARDVDLDFAVIQARASYKFNWWGSPVVARY
jgi:outer membrane immunogenic protein